MKNYIEKQGNKTAIFVNGTPILIDTSELNRLERKVHSVEINEKGFPVAIMPNGKSVPLSVLTAKAKKDEQVFFKNGKNDCRRASLEVTVRETNE